MNGALEQTGTETRLRFRRPLPHPPEKVWRAITEPDHLAAWFPHRIIGEWTPGAPLQFVYEAGEIPDFSGQVLAVERPRLLEFRWDTDTIRLEIEPSEEGCVLTLVDTLTELGKAARDAAGWHSCLDALEYELAGTPDRSVLTTHWSEVHAGYVEEFGPAASVIGPPEGMAPASS